MLSKIPLPPNVRPMCAVSDILLIQHLADRQRYQEESISTIQIELDFGLLAWDFHK